MVTLDFSKCKTAADVNRVYEQNAEILNKTKEFMKLGDKL